MLTKARIKKLVAELTAENLVALIRCEAGKPFDGKVAIGRLRELELVEKASWSCTEEGRQVVGELVGIPYKRASMIAGVPVDEPHRTSDERVKARYASGNPDGQHRRLAAEEAASGSSAPRTSKPNGKHKPAEGVELGLATSNRASICFQCREEVPKGSSVIWIQDEGLFHVDCVETS